MEPSGRISPLLRMQEHIPPPAERAGRRRRAASPPSRATSPEERPQQQDSWVPDQPVRADSINATGPGGFWRVWRLWHCCAAEGGQSLHGRSRARV